MTFRSIRQLFGRLRPENGPRGPQSPGGMKVLAAYPEPPTRRFFWEADIRLLEDGQERLFRVCGHRSRAVGMSVYGNEKRLDPAKLADEMPGRCPECMLAWLRPLAIRCAFCGYGIVPRDPVALYDPASPGIDLGRATVVLEGVIGCTREDCSPGGFEAGHWHGERLEPSFGGRTIAEEAARTGKVHVGTV